LRRLTGAHRCQVCHDDIRNEDGPVGFGRRRCTVLHHPDRARNPQLTDNCRTDVYAGLYFCPHPQCRAFLETPSHQWGQPVSCPVCSGPFVAPFDDLLHRHAGDAREGEVFSFPCPNCSGSLRCDTAREGRPTRDLHSICVHCHHVIAIPGGGTPVKGSAPHA
jgi:hypothetical protein